MQHSSDSHLWVTTYGSQSQKIFYLAGTICHFWPWTSCSLFSLLLVHSPLQNKEFHPFEVYFSSCTNQYFSRNDLSSQPSITPCCLTTLLYLSLKYPINIVSHCTLLATLESLSCVSLARAHVFCNVNLQKSCASLLPDSDVFARDSMQIPPILLFIILSGIW